jgi:hypothetical protein
MLYRPLTFITKDVYIAFTNQCNRTNTMATINPAAALERYHRTFDEMERRGARLLDAGASPAKLGSDLLCVLLRLQCEGRFTDVDAAALEDIIEQVVAAQEDER